MIDLKHKYSACATLLNPSSAEPLVWPSPHKFISELNPDAKHLLEKALMEANREGEKDILKVLEEAYCEEYARSVTDDMIFQVHVLGEGIIGQAALDGNHIWVLSDSSTGKCSLTGHFKIQEDNSLFSCGFSSRIKTLAVIPLQSCGVLQFGSVQIVGHNLIVWLIPLQYRHHKQRAKSGSWKAIIGVVSAVSLVQLDVFIVWLLSRRKRRVRQFEEGEGGCRSSIESLHFDFGVIRLATDYFSDANKLGR